MTRSLFDALGRPDPTPWLLASGEPQARWVTLAHLVPDASFAELAAAHDAVLGDAATQAVLDMLPASWDEPADVSGHNRPELVTNVLDLLADVGVTENDDPRIGRLLDGMLERTDGDGRFQAHAVQRSGPPVWGCLLCDTHAVADILGRYGRAGDPRVRRALAAAEADLVATDPGTADLAAADFGRTDLAATDLGKTGPGLAWPCRPDPVTGFRGPGRASDPCPQTTLEALRAFSWLPPAERPPWLPNVVHTLLEVWRQRGTRKPYMMGHGRQFKQVKWPSTWYGAYEVVDVLGRLPEAWRANAEDRRSVAEIAACLLAYNVASDGRVMPLSTFRGWEFLSLGRKAEPSPLATALVWSRLAALVVAVDVGGPAPGFAEDIAAVDVMSLGSSKGGSGRPMPPKVT